MNELLELPVETLVVLGAGYMAYCTAYTGLRENHKTLDTTFISIAFGMIAKLSLVHMQSLDHGEVMSYVLAISVSLIAAALWRFCVKSMWLGLLKFFNVSFSDGTRSAWDAVRTGTQHQLTELQVQMKSGRILKSSDLAAYQNEVFGPCVFGEDGSIGLYVDKLKEKDEADFKPRTAKFDDHYWGSKFTYIPASDIQRIDVRAKRPNRI